MTIDPKDVGELQKALNDAANKASVLWTSFIIFQLYLVITFGSVTHRDLFLETPIKMPVLNVDLPLVGFFVVVPIILIAFHFYLFLQLLALAKKAIDYNTLLRQRRLSHLIADIFGSDWIHLLFCSSSPVRGNNEEVSPAVRCVSLHGSP